jgi:hypothetical protein
MRAVVDSSCWVAVALEEPGWRAVLRSLSGYELAASPLLEAELAAALKREGVTADRRALLAGLAWLLPDRPLGPELDRIFAAGHLRGADAWHLAHALWLAPDGRDLSFLTLDEAQRTAARALGLSAPTLARRPTVG